MKIYILFSFKNGPWGGGNQFLKALRDAFRSAGILTEKISDADVVLFNSHSFLDPLILAKLFFVALFFGPKRLVHRVDGPVFSVRGKDMAIDRLIFSFNHLMASGTVFQSEWSRKECVRYGLKRKVCETVIANAANKAIFFPAAEMAQTGMRKTRLLATSWSSNMRKGFEIYKFLDDSMDFRRYEMTFVGNAPIAFRNIRCIPPQDSRTLADILRGHDIYITASANDPCSNALIEALSCGLPCVALDSGGHPELIGGGGELFKGMHDVLDVIDAVARDRGRFFRRRTVADIDEVAMRYRQFCETVLKGAPAKVPFRSWLAFLSNLLIYHARLLSAWFLRRTSA